MEQWEAVSLTSVLVPLCLNGNSPRHHHQFNPLTWGGGCSKEDYQSEKNYDAFASSGHCFCPRKCINKIKGDTKPLEGRKKKGRRRPSLESLSRQDSNLENWYQKPTCCHYTTGQRRFSSPELSCSAADTPFFPERSWGGKPAALPGLEPRIPEPESGVLPITP